MLSGTASELSGSQAGMQPGFGSGDGNVCVCVRTCVWVCVIVWLCSEALACCKGVERRYVKGSACCVGVYRECALKESSY